MFSGSSTKQIKHDQSNSLGIPSAEFLEDVESFMNEDENKGNVELVLTRLEEQFGKYKFMEMSLFGKKKILMKQVPDIKASLDMLKILKLKKQKEETINTRFMGCEDLYFKAVVPPTDKVGLWLGANVMLEYDLKEAEEFLTKNLKAAIKQLSQLEVDIDFLREQLTTTEVNMARVYNWDVTEQQNHAC